jgi:hypothetical protein
VFSVYKAACSWADGELLFTPLAIPECFSWALTSQQPMQQLAAHCFGAWLKVLLLLSLHSIIAVL